MIFRYVIPDFSVLYISFTIRTISEPQYLYSILFMNDCLAHNGRVAVILEIWNNKTRNFFEQSFQLFLLRI